MSRIAIHAITRRGAGEAHRLWQRLSAKTGSGVDLFVSDKFAAEAPDAQLFPMPLSDHINRCFSGYQAHVFFFSIGIATRMVAPLIQDKRLDPAVVCVDEAATFCVPVLSGHRGGANQLALQISELLKSTPVLTTASDASQTLSVDLLGAPFGWTLDPACEPAITAVSAAVVNQEPVLIVQEAGEQTWWKHERKMPKHLHCTTGLDNVELEQYQALILISDRADVLNDQRLRKAGLGEKCVLWRPRSVVLGVGCDRDTPRAVLAAGLEQFCAEHNLAQESVAALTSIALKADETGLVELASELARPFDTFAVDKLDGVEGIENPSETVKRCVGVSSVAEAAALYRAGQNQLLAPKWKFKQDGKNMTLAACRLAFDEPLKSKRRKFFADMPVEENHHSVRKNAMGSEVVPGAKCKPAHVDLNRPMMHYRHHIILCQGARCAKAAGTELAHELRKFLKRSGLDRGVNRIKISRSHCAGSCRNRAAAVVYENAPEPVNNAVWLRKTDEFSSRQWQQVFEFLTEGKSLRDELEPQHIAPVEQLIETHRAVT